MDKFKEITLKLLYPNILLFILFFIIGFGGVILVFLYGLETTIIGYVTYPVSAYALTITVARSIDLIKWINKKIHTNKYTSKIIKNKELKINISLTSGTLFNIIYGIFKFITGLIYKSIWFSATGVYYLVLGFMKVFLVKHIIKKTDLKKQLKQYKLTGLFMFFLNVTMVGMIILMIREGNSAVYPGFIIYAQAAYTFYILTFAIINIIKYRKNHSPIIAASKSINLVASVMSLFILQVAMINEFGEEGIFKLIINTITGTITSIITIGIAIYMLMNKETKK